MTAGQELRRSKNGTEATPREKRWRVSCTSSCSFAPRMAYTEQVDIFPKEGCTWNREDRQRT